MDWSESDLADLLIQPVEHTYTVESLEKLAGGCGLDIIAPCVSPYARSLCPIWCWSLEFDDDELQDRYDSLPDSRRWQVTNLVLQEKSPLLWFYLEKKESRRRRKTERQICEDFLNSRFEPASTLQRSYIRSETGSYDLSPASVHYPFAHTDQMARRILDAVDRDTDMRQVFERSGLEATFRNINHARTRLTTSAFPYLKAVSNDAD
jgi:hypothetical protein